MKPTPNAAAGPAIPKTLWRRGSSICRVEEKWIFATVDVIAILTDGPNPQVYWRVMKKRLNKDEGNETMTNCHGLKMTAADGKQLIFTILPELEGMTESPGPGTFYQADQPAVFGQHHGPVPQPYHSRPVRRLAPGEIP